MITAFLPISAGAQNLETVEVNLAALQQFGRVPSYAPVALAPPPVPQYVQQQQAYEVAQRPELPLYQVPAGYPPVPQKQQIEEPQPLIEGDFSGNVGFVTDYTFRGVTQTREAPAVQGGFDYAHPSGGYVGIWASSLEFGDGEAGTEIDYYAGYSADVGNGITADGGVIYYQYPSANSSLNYDFVEVYGGLSTEVQIDGQDVAADASLSVSPDYFGGSGAAYYAKLGASTPLPHGFTLDGHVGYQWIEDNDTFLLPDYADWSVGIGYELEGFELKAQYIDTSISSDDCADGCDAKGVLSVSRSL